MWESYQCLHLTSDSPSDNEMAYFEKMSFSSCEISTAFRTHIKAYTHINSFALRGSFFFLFWENHVKPHLELLLLHFFINLWNVWRWAVVNSNGSRVCAPEQTHYWALKVRCVSRGALRSVRTCFQCLKLRWNSSSVRGQAFWETLRSSDRKLLLPSNTPHLTYLTGLLLVLSRCERINVTGNVFGSVTFSVKQCILDWVEMEATGLDFILNFICPLSVTDRQSAGEAWVSEEGGKRSQGLTAVKHTNSDVFSSLNHGGFRDKPFR